MYRIFQRQRGSTNGQVSSIIPLTSASAIPFVYKLGSFGANSSRVNTKSASRRMNILVHIGPETGGGRSAVSVPATGRPQGREAVGDGRSSQSAGDAGHLLVAAPCTAGAPAGRCCFRGDTVTPRHDHEIHKMIYTHIPRNSGSQPFLQNVYHQQKLI